MKEKDKVGKKDDRKKPEPKKEEKKKADNKKKDFKIAQLIELEDTNTYNMSQYGVSSFYLHQILGFQKKSKDGFRFKLMAGVHPNKAQEQDSDNNLDLNYTAKKEEVKIISSTKYFQHQTTIVLGFNLAYPLNINLEKQTKE